MQGSRATAEGASAGGAHLQLPNQRVAHRPGAPRLFLSQAKLRLELLVVCGEQVPLVRQVAVPRRLALRAPQRLRRRRQLPQCIVALRRHGIEGGHARHQAAQFRGQAMLARGRGGHGACRACRRPRGARDGQSCRAAARGLQAGRGGGGRRAERCMRRGRGSHLPGSAGGERTRARARSAGAARKPALNGRRATGRRAQAAAYDPPKVVQRPVYRLKSAARSSGAARREKACRSRRA